MLCGICNHDTGRIIWKPELFIFWGACLETFQLERLFLYLLQTLHLAPRWFQLATIAIPAPQPQLFSICEERTFGSLLRRAPAVFSCSQSVVALKCRDAVNCHEQGQKHLAQASLCAMQEWLLVRLHLQWIVLPLMPFHHSKLSRKASLVNTHPTFVR